MIYVGLLGGLFVVVGLWRIYVQFRREDKSRDRTRDPSLDRYRPPGLDLTGEQEFIVERGGIALGQMFVAFGILLLVLALAGCGGGDDTGLAGSTSSSETTTSDTKSSSDGDKDATTSTSTDDGDGGTGDAPLPDCFEDHLNQSPRVHPEDHLRLNEGINESVLVVMHQFDGVAIELADDNEVLGVMRVGDQSETIGEDWLHIFDVVDASCQPIAFSPEDSSDDIEDTHTTTVPLQLDGESYVLTFVQHGIMPEIDVILRQAG